VANKNISTTEMLKSRVDAARIKRQKVPAVDVIEDNAVNLGSFVIKSVCFNVKDVPGFIF
jgi:hypothetical protein